MNSPHALAALADTGKAVLISQALEKLLVELLEFRKLHQDFDYAVDTKGTVAQGLYKGPVMNGVKLLRQQGALHATLDAALVKYIDDRHILVHRWALQHGIPDDSDTLAWHALQAHARSVGDQAGKLHGFFVRYLAEYAMPEVAAQDYPTYQQRMLTMFNREYVAV